VSIAPPATWATWSITAVSILGVIARPRNLPEALWAVSGALALVLFSLLPAPDAWAAVLKGTDVYLFLIGMMVLSELARQGGLFDWLAGHAVKRSRGSAATLFALIYAVGIAVTIFLSNDATAVVLTPAVYAAAKHAKAPPLPYLFACAFIANAASFALPISNPANLVIFGNRMPTLANWLMQFGLPSIVSIGVTYAVLLFTQRRRLAAAVSEVANSQPLRPAGRMAAGAIVLTAVILLTSSALNWSLGLPTCMAGLSAALVIGLLRRASPVPVFKAMSWSVLPLVAGLFVLVEGIERTGVLAPLIHMLSAGSQTSPKATAWAAGVLVALGSNLLNNLPVGLLAGTVTQSAQLSAHTVGALLIGVDLGPNLSITGSLATILWLVAIRREGENVSAMQFIAVGSLVMLPALFASLGVLSLTAGR
jgi:arsenical pump membrane protein